MIEKQDKKDNNMKKSPKDNRPFSEKHPRWNLFFGFLLLLGFLVISMFFVFYIFKYIGLGIGLFIDWLKDIASKLEAVVIVALITGTVSLTGVILSSIVAKSIDYKKSRKTYLAQKREKSYGAFVEMVYKIQRNSKKANSYTEQEMIDDMLSFSQELTLWGSNKVANKWVQFRLNGANPDSAQENLFLLESIMNEMRHDMGVKRVKKGNLLSFFVNDVKETMKAKKK